MIPGVGERADREADHRPEQSLRDRRPRGEIEDAGRDARADRRIPAPEGQRGLRAAPGAHRHIDEIADPGFVVQAHRRAGAGGRGDPAARRALRTGGSAKY